MKKTTIREATEQWINEFSNVPGSVIEKMSEGDEMIKCFDSDSFRLIASPRIECLYCSASYEGDLSLAELKEADENKNGVSCEYCNGNTGDYWGIGYPEYAFPCGWGTLFAPKNNLDIDWIIKNHNEVSSLGFFVFESEDFGVLLGIDAGGFDFYEAYWVPLYKLRGLQWHD